MENLKEKFEVVWNTKHKDEIKMVFKVPVGNNKKWYEFWKRQNKPEKTIIELMDRYREDVNFDENTGEIFIPVKDSK
jgi:protein tyrosine phosphatase